MINRMTSFVTVFFTAAKKANVATAFFTVIVFMLIIAYMIYQQTLLLQGDLEDYANIIQLLRASILERAFKSFNDILVKRFIIKPFVLEVTSLLTELLVTLSPSSLLQTKTDIAAIDNPALSALKSVMVNIITVFTPLVLLISRGAALTQVLNPMQLIIVSSCLTAVFLAGLAILIYDHRKEKNLAKEETDLRERERSFIRSIASIVVNGMGIRLPSWMKELKRKVLDLRTNHESIMEALYGLLEIATVAIPIAISWILKGSSHFLPLFIVMQPMFWNAWFLFFTVKSLVVETAPFHQFQEFIDDAKLPSPNLTEPKSAEDMVSSFSTHAINEIRLDGGSGCGKSTMMKKLVSGICDNFVLGFILYIEQFPSLPLCITPLEYFSLGFTGSLPEDFLDKLLTYADRLGLAHLINQGTLSTPFKKPSGGELKRLIFLHYVLPILLGVSKVQIIFLDEVTAGLDDATFTMVRAIITELEKRGIKVVSIDHHDYHVDLSAKIFKKEVPNTQPQKPLKKPSFLVRMVNKFFPHIYHRKDEDIEKGSEKEEQETAIEVWSPALGIEEP
jgi:ABC-type iron transport system FetAB ATPase subunit